MSRGRKPRPKRLISSRTMPKPLSSIAYPKENIRKEYINIVSYEFETDEKILVKYKKDSMALGLNIYNREIGEIEFKQHLLTFLRYADAASNKPSMIDCVFENECGHSLVVVNAGGGIKIEIRKDNKHLASTLMPMRYWRIILKNISGKMRNIQR